MNKNSLVLVFVNLIILQALSKGNGKRFKNQIIEINNLFAQKKTTWQAKDPADFDLDQDQVIQKLASFNLPLLMHRRAVEEKAEKKIEDLLKALIAQLLAAAILKAIQNKKKLPPAPVPPPVPTVTSFDLRTKYPRCWSISYVRDQAGCGSCWAVSAAPSLSDRYCIYQASLGKKSQRSFSYQHMMAGCPRSLCGYNGDGGDPCNGGYFDKALMFARDTGIVSGENYGNYTACQSYFLAAGKSATSIPLASTQCDALSTYKKTFANDLVKIKSYNFIKKTTTTTVVQEMMRSIVNKGSIVVGIEIFGCFFNYKSGIYQKISTTSYGGHAVRVVGYGTEGGIDFWIVANSWGPNWGEKGFVRIRKGVNMVDIESWPAEGNFA